MRILTLAILPLLTLAACQKPATAPSAAASSSSSSSAANDPQADHDHAHDHDMTGVSAEIPAPSGTPGVVDVYMSPTCGCCGKWVDHLRANGLTVNAHKVQSPIPVKEKFGLPRELASCHSAVVDGYLVEGHVPASVVKRLIKERPKVVGVSVPKMPEGSPGMEGPNPQAYDVMAFTADGTTSRFQHIPVQ